MARRLYTPELANRSLPLVRRIATDVQVEARRVQALLQALRAARPADAAAREDELAAARDRLHELVDELAQLGVELKDPMTGLLDFRASRGGTEVYLCWRLGEESVAHWHELEAGFAGRRPIAEY